MKVNNSAVTNLKGGSKCITATVLSVSSATFSRQVSMVIADVRQLLLSASQLAVNCNL